MKKIIAIVLGLILLISHTFIANADVNITAQYGDVNLSSSVDGKDATLLMQYINGWEFDIFIAAAADVNVDDKVNNKDYVLLVRYINGWDVELGEESLKIEIDYDTVVEVDICDNVIREYLNANTIEEQFDLLNQYSGTRHDSQGVSLDWRMDASYTYTVTFSENADFSNAHTIETKFTDVKNTILIPGKTYYWKVTGSWSDEVLGGGKIHVKDAPVRWIGIDGVGNVRDMGGWKAENGKTVKYGMLYRGQKLESVTENGIATIKQLGLKTELDIRYASQKFQTPGTGMNYEFIESPGQYDSVMKREPEVFKASYKRIFELLADKNNYPFYAHCNAGADRTGTYAFIVNGVLGVSYEDLTRDFELTSFSSSGKRWRGAGTGNTFGENDLVMQEDSSNTVAWGRLYKEMMDFGAKNGCTTLQESIEYWLTSYIGVPQEQIDSFKKIMLK